MPLKVIPLRLNPEEYLSLCKRIMQRDGWRCQECGSWLNLEVHHQVFRSQGGTDEEHNLITLCTRCHTENHRKFTLK
jgi:5-methylcytosine-specific restriction endonuclease McrA